ncbi:NmrA domain-containing protein [Mycena venus]|uniref:NmrA domain-containing protein n=1 Tax=Mycena venus TaxID=2733690 RepID=A0A8H7DCJ6_9AGAR|nr:NmrA domain-containing protein [Mycena venus]
MTITKDSSAPLVAVVGIAGVQGGSVVKELAESSKSYRVRGFTRDATKPAAQARAKQGVEVVTVSIVVENKDEVYKAFAGADVAFLVTDYWEHMDMEREINEGKLQIDAAKAGGVKRIVWSGMPSFKIISNGKYTNIEDCEGKFVVSEYGRASGVPFVDVQAGYYGTTVFSLPILIGDKQADGTYDMPWPVHPTTVLPFIDATHDYGLFVRHVLELPTFPDGQTVVAYGEKITLQDMAAQLAKGTGKPVTFKEITPDQFKTNLGTMGLPASLHDRMAAAWGALADFGWEVTNTHDGLPRKPRSWAEFVAHADWSKALA